MSDVKYTLTDGHANPILTFKLIHASLLAGHLQFWAKPNRTFEVRQVTMLPETPFSSKVQGTGKGSRTRSPIEYLKPQRNDYYKDEVYNILGA
jgi:hypothetical protein